MIEVDIGVREVEPRVVLYGPGGVGKSSLAAQAPSPLFIDPTGGTDKLDVKRVKGVITWMRVLEIITYLTTEAHGFKTLVIDEIGAIEQLGWDHLCDLHTKKSVGDWGYQRGYELSLDLWHGLMVRLDKMRAARNIGIVLIGHSLVTTFKNPEGLDYNRYVLKVHKKLGPKLLEWVDYYLFCRYEEGAGKVDPSDDKSKTIGVNLGARFVHTIHKAAFDAKNRGDMPPKLPMKWDTVFGSIGKPIDAEDALNQLAELLELLSEKDAATVAEYIEHANGDPRKLVRTLDWAKAKAGV